jgi:hypothetical protein
MKFIAKYVREHNGQGRGKPIGLVLALRDEAGKVSFGWSSCDTQDNFSCKTAVELAKKRALTHSKKPIPSTLFSMLEPGFIARCETYFKEENLSVKAFGMGWNGKKKLYEITASKIQNLSYNPPPIPKKSKKAITA